MYHRKGRHQNCWNSVGSIEFTCRTFNEITWDWFVLFFYFRDISGAMIHISNCLDQQSISERIVSIMGTSESVALAQRLINIRSVYRIFFISPSCVYSFFPRFLKIIFALDVEFINVSVPCCFLLVISCALIIDLAIARIGLAAKTMFNENGANFLTHERSGRDVSIEWVEGSRVLSFNG